MFCFRESVLTFKKMNKFIITSLFFLIISYTSKAQTSEQSEKEIKAVWYTFLDAVSSKDFAIFKKLSNKKIRCYNCPENTEAEREKIYTLRKTDTLWYDKLYNDLIYIPVDHFIENDFEIIFTPSFIKKLKEKKTLYHQNSIDGVDYYEVFVTTLEPKNDHDGGQHNFQFKKVNGKWVFNEIGTIP